MMRKILLYVDIVEFSSLMHIEYNFEPMADFVRDKFSDYDIDIHKSIGDVQLWKPYDLVITICANDFELGQLLKIDSPFIWLGNVAKIYIDPKIIAYLPFKITLSKLVDKIDSYFESIDILSMIER